MDISFLQLPSHIYQNLRDKSPGSWEVRQAGGGLHLAGGEAGCPHRGAFAGPAPGRGVGCVTGHAVTRRHDPRTKVAATKTNTPTLSAVSRCCMNGDYWWLEEHISPGQRWPPPRPDPDPYSLPMPEYRG